MFVRIESTSPAADITSFPVTHLDDVGVAGQADIVQNLYGHGSLIAMVGVPNSGKTALAIDHGLALATNAEHWFGLKISPGPVIYIASEAPGSVIMRATAARLRKYPDQRPAFYIVKDAPQLGGELTSFLDAERVIATIRYVESNEGRAVKLVMLDTLASCLGSGDENGEGMIALVNAAKRIAAVTECAVMLIHHPSKGDSQGLRGHGSLGAACDTILSITVDEVSGLRTATLIKSRDSATGLELAYTLEQVRLPEPDTFGDPRTTIIVQPATGQRHRPRPGGARQQALLTELERRYRTGERMWDEASVRKAGRDLGMHRNSPIGALKGLQRAGYIVGDASRLTLKHPPEDAV